MMFLSNFQSYVESDYSYEYIEVQLNARIADFNILTNPVEIYTYKDSSYLLLADSDTESIASQIYIYPQRNMKYISSHSGRRINNLHTKHHQLNSHNHRLIQYQFGSSLSSNFHRNPHRLYWSTDLPIYE